VRFKTAVILSVVVVGGILFVFPAVVEAVFLPSLKQGIPNPIPDCEAILLDAAFFCHRFRWLIAPLTVLLFFLIAAFTRESAVRR
jgi:type II secretory pathway component PulF